MTLTHLDQQALESYLWGAANLLRGLIDAGDYKQYVFPLLFFKRLSDVWDEEYRSALDETGDADYAQATADDRFVIPAGAHWSDVRGAARDVGRKLRGAFRAIETVNPERLAGVFGNAPWTDKAQMPDATLKNLIEHFSQHTLSLAAVPEDELGNAYEYLVKQFADDSGHTAHEFYTNRTLVHLMTQMLRPRPGERIYDPTAGTGGMLISALAEVQRKGGDARTLGLYGQEIIGTTASIARMNLVLHGVEDFRIAVGNALSAPAFIERDRLMTFDVVLANPPYSIKTWNRDVWRNDPWGRNFLGTPPQGRADYAFFQHILRSLDPRTGRCAILFPHGVLFRQEEAAMRRALIERDLVECVLGLGPNLFYNSPMEACVVVCRTRKPPRRRGKVLFIDAVREVARERAQSFLAPEHQQRILSAYRSFTDEPGFSAVATTEQVLANDGNLSIPRYVRSGRRRDRSDGNAQPTTCGAPGANSRRAAGTSGGRWTRRSRCSTGSWRRAGPMGSGKLKPGWTRVAFGDVVRLSAERTSDPEAAGLERYVGLEHLDPGDLTIRRWGDVAAGTTFTSIFRPGQVLFGKRRAYQRKVGVPDFKGVCSGDIYVFECKDDRRLLPKLLPFICQTETFFEQAVGTSAGSLSPRTNWRSLATYDFALPPLGEQRRIAVALQETDRTTEALLALIEAVRVAQASVFDTHVTNFDTRTVALGSLLTEAPRNGCSAPEASTPTGHWVLALDALTKSGYGPGRFKPVQRTAAILNSVVSAGDLLISRSNTRDRVGLSGIFNEARHDVSWPDTMMRLRPDTSVLRTRFLELFLRSTAGRHQIERFAAGTSASMKKINAHAVRQLLIALPTPDSQDVILRKADRVTSARGSADFRLRHVKRMRSTMLSSVL